ncbi:mediator of DNA damage checkpoint protein 1 [Pelodytes ibericus]
MDQTQRLVSDDEEEDVPADRHKPVAMLHMFSGTYGAAQDFAIYRGQNIIGRHANCDIVLPAQSVSKKHAILTVQADCHTICDCGSLNKTRRGKAALTPHVRYALESGNFLLFADVACRYTINEVEKKPEVEEPAAPEESEDDSILVPGTQAALVIEKTPGAAIRRMGRGTVLARDSGEEDENEEEECVSGSNEDNKGFGLSRDVLKASTTGTFLSPTSDTFVPESDEEIDTSVSQCRFPSLNLRCDSDTDTHETPTRRESLAVSSQSFFSSPCVTEKKGVLTTESGDGSHQTGSISSVSAGGENKPVTGHGALQESLGVNRKHEDSCTEEPQRRTHKASSVSPVAGQENAGFERGPEASRTNLASDTNAGEGPSSTGQKETAGVGFTLNSDTDDDDLPSLVKSPKRKVKPVVLDSDEDDVPTSVQIPERKVKPVVLDSDEDDVPTSVQIPERKVKPVVLDSDEDDVPTSVQVPERKVKPVDLDSDEDDVPTSLNVQKRKVKPVDLDSDEDDVPTSVQVPERKVKPVDLDSDEDDVPTSLNVQKRKVKPVDLDSDEDDVPNSVQVPERKVKPVDLDSDEDVEGEAEASILDAKEEETGFNINSDTDIEDDDGDATTSGAALTTEGCLGNKTTTATSVEDDESSTSKVATEQNDESKIDRDSDTDVEEEDLAAVNVTEKENNGKSKKPEASLCDTGAEVDHDLSSKVDGKKDVVQFNLDSDTDVEDEDGDTSGGVEKINKSLGTERTPMTTLRGQVKGEENSRESAGRAAELAFHMDSDTDVEESDDDQMVEHSSSGGAGDNREENRDSGPAVGQGGATKREETCGAAAEIHVDSDTDVDEDIGPRQGAEDDKGEPVRDEEADVMKQTAGLSLINGDGELPGDDQKENKDPSGALLAEKTQDAESESSEYDLCATQCYLESEDRPAGLPDDDHCTEEATQAFVLSSTWTESDQFKRPADPIPVLEISPVHRSGSEEDSDENILAETQSYISETDTPTGDCVQETAQSVGDSAETEAPSDRTVSQDDTQPVSQTLVTRPPHGAGTWVHLKREVPSSVWAERGFGQSGVEEEATQPYSLMEEEETQAFTLNVPASVDSLHEHDASIPGSLLATEDHRSETDSSQVPTPGEDCKQPGSLSLPSASDQNALGSSEKTAQEISDKAQPQIGENEEPGGAGERSGSGKAGVDQSGEGIVERDSLLSGLTEKDTKDEGPSGFEDEGTIHDGESKEDGIGRAKRTQRGEAETKEEKKNTLSRFKGRNKTTADVQPSTSGAIEEGRIERTTRKSLVGINKAERVEEKEHEAADATDVVSGHTSDEKEIRVNTNEQSKESPLEESVAQSAKSADRNGGRAAVLGLGTDSALQKNGGENKTAAPEKEEATKSEETTEKPTTSSGPDVENLEEAVCERIKEEDGVSLHLSEGQEQEDGKRVTKRRLGIAREAKEIVATSTAENSLSMRKRVTRKSQVAATESAEQKPVGTGKATNSTSEVEEKVEKVNPVVKSSGRGQLRATRRTGRAEEEGSAGETSEAVKSVSKAQTKNSQRQVEPSNQSQDSNTPEKDTIGKPVSRRTRRNSREDGTQDESEDKGKPEQEPARSVVSKRTRSLSREEEGASKPNEGKADEESVRTPVSRRTRRSFRGEETNVLNEDKGKAEADTVSTLVTRRTRRNSRGEGTNVQNEDKPKAEENLVSRPTSRRTRKNSREEENADKKEQEREDPVRKSRRTRKDLQEDQANEGATEDTEVIELEKQTPRRTRREAQDGENVALVRQPLSRRTRKNSTEGEAERPEQIDPPKTSARGRRNLKEEVKEEQVTVEIVAEPEKEGPPGKPTLRRGRRNSREGPKTEANEAEQTQPVVNTKRRKPSSRTRQKKASEEDGDGQGEAAPSHELQDVEPTTHEKDSNGATESKLRASEEEIPQVTTLLQTRKRGQGAKDVAVELKRKKSEEEAELEGSSEGETSSLAAGKRGRSRRMAAAAGKEKTENGKRKESLAPVPSPTENSSAEVRTPRRTNRAKSIAGTSSPSIQQSANPKVLFTGVLDSAGEETIRALGGEIADSVFDCTHLVTDRVIRTVKFLCALARGIPIVRRDWIEKCKKSGCFLSPAGFLVNDKEQEKKFNFVLSNSLQKAKRRALFQGYEIHVTSNVKPEPDHMKDIICCSGATFLPKLPRSYKEKCVIVSCQEDAAQLKGVPPSLPITTAEFILSGILRQEADPAAYLLNPGSSNEPVPTPAKRRR